MPIITALAFAGFLSAQAVIGSSMVVNAGPRRPGPRSGPTVSDNANVKPEYVDEDTGLIKSWKGASDLDTKILKQAIETGYLNGCTTKAIKDEYQRFRRFTNKCLGDKVSNLRRSFRDQVETRADMRIHGGGGQQLPAHASNYDDEPDNFQERFGNDIYDESNDEDYIDETMSRMTLDHDDLSFADQSLAFQSRAGSRAPCRESRDARSVGGVSFRSDTRGSSGTSRPGILRNRAAAPSAAAANGASPAPAAATRVEGRVEIRGGAPIECVRDHWNDGVPQKRVSVQLQTLSGDFTPNSLTVRVSTDQKHLVVSKPMSQGFVDPSETFEYICKTLQKQCKCLDDKEKCHECSKNHARYIARVKSIERLQQRDPTVNSVNNEIRIPLGIKCDFDFVSQEEDPIFFGVATHETRDGEFFIFVECKGESKDGHRMQKKKITPFDNFPGVRSCAAMDAASRRGGMDSIPETVSVDRTDGSSGSYESRSHAPNSGRYFGFSSASLAASRRSRRSVRTGEAETVHSMEISTKCGGNDGDEELFERLDEVEGDFEMTRQKAPFNQDGNETYYSGAASVAKSPRKRTKTDIEDDEEFSAPEGDKKPAARPTPTSRSPTKKAPAKKSPKKASSTKAKAPPPVHTSDSVVNGGRSVAQSTATHVVNSEGVTVKGSRRSKRKCKGEKKSDDDFTV